MSDSSLKFNNARSMSTGPTQTKKKKLVWKFLCGCGSDVETFGDVPVHHVKVFVEVSSSYYVNRKFQFALDVLFP